MGWLRVPRVALRLFSEIGRDDLSGAASELAYKFFLALFPFFIFLAALGGFAADAFDVQNPTDEVMDVIGTSLPPDAASLLREQVDAVIDSQNAALLSIGIVGAVWAASAGMGTIMKSLNRIYEVKETRSLPRRYGLAVGMTLLAGGFIIAAFVLLVVGQIYGTRIADELGAADSASSLISLVRWPAAIVLLLVAVAFLFWAAPNIDLPFKWISPGAVMFVALWLPSTYLFSIYVANFGSYGETYGTLGGVVVLLIWLYLTSLVLLLGAELNAVLAQQTAPGELEARAGEGATRRTRHGSQEPLPEEPAKPGIAGVRQHWPEVVFGTVTAAITVWGAAIKPRLHHGGKQQNPT